MRVLVPPVVVEGKICRIVAPIPTLIEVQEWMGGYWLPSDVPLAIVSCAPFASIALLRVRGVPKSDCLADDTTTRVPLTEARLIEMAVETEVRIVSEDETERTERMKLLARREKYPGSKRFRRYADPSPDASPDISGHTSGNTSHSNDKKSGDTRL